MKCFFVSWSLALPLLSPLHAAFPPQTLYLTIIFNQSLGTFDLIWFLGGGQLPYDGILVGHCLVYIFSVMATGWGSGCSEGVCSVDCWSNHAWSMKGQHCQYPKDPFVRGCVWWGPCHLHETVCLLIHDGTPLWGPVTTNGGLLQCQLCLLQYLSAVASNDEPLQLWCL